MAAGTLAKIVNLREVDGVICANSRDIARDFRQRPPNVLRDINKIVETIKEGSHLGALNWFREEYRFQRTVKASSLLGYDGRRVRFSHWSLHWPGTSRMANCLPH